MTADIAFIGGRGLFSNYGGVENAIREITLQLAEKQTLINVYGINNEIDSIFELPQNVKRISIYSWIYQFLGQHGLIFSSVLLAIFRDRPRLVIVFASGPCIFTPLLRLGGLKVITSLRAIDSERDKWGVISRQILRLGEYCAWKFPQHFTVNSLDMVRLFKAKRKDVVFIANGAKAATRGDEHILEQLKVKPFQYFLFAARLDPVKRLDILLVAHSLLRDMMRFPLIVAGGHVKDPEYERTIQALANDQVFFIGHISQDQLNPLMYYCRAFILPSILEGMSNSLLSAMASKRPVIAADVPANRDVIKEETDALFTADDINELSIKMFKLAAEPEYCTDLGNRLHKVTEAHYSWKKTASQFYQLAKPLIKNTNKYDNP